MLTAPLKASVEVSRKRTNTRTNENGTTSTFRNIALRDVGSYGPGIECMVEESVFDRLNEGDEIEATLYQEPRRVQMIGRKGQPYEGTVISQRLVDAKVTKPAQRSAVAA